MVIASQAKNTLPIYRHNILATYIQFQRCAIYILRGDYIRKCILTPSNWMKMYLFFQIFFFLRTRNMNLVTRFSIGARTHCIQKIELKKIQKPKNLGSIMRRYNFWCSKPDGAERKKKLSFFYNWTAVIISSNLCICVIVYYFVGEAKIDSDSDSDSDWNSIRISRSKFTRLD